MTVTEPGPDGRPRVTRGIRGNLGFEGMALTPSSETLYLANEQALAQDGPVVIARGRHQRPDPADGAVRRREAAPTAEYVYAVEKAFAASTDPNSPADNGVSAMLWVRHCCPSTTCW